METLERLAVDVDVPLVGDVSLPRLLAAVPKGATIKGMFCARYVSAIDEPWDEVSEDLDAPPADGHYTAFEDYPFADYQRLLDKAARNRFPRSSTREAYRLLGRGDVEVFACSTLGKVTLSLLKDPAAAVTRYPEIVGVLTRGSVSGAATRTDAGVSVYFPRVVGAPESAIGILEAIVMLYEAKPRVELAVHPGGSATFHVSWTS